MDKNTGSQANRKYKELLDERTKRVMQRDVELQRRNLPIGLDGFDYYQDIDGWFDSEVKKLKKEYGI